MKEILRCGYLIPTFAPRTIAGTDHLVKTIHGPYPAVCFTEQPLSAFISSCNTLTDRYEPYGIAVRKDRLFVYGGRPAVYGDNSLRDALQESYKYLWVNFRPIPRAGGYPNDWTHEREWRAKVTPYQVRGRGAYLSDGVPLLLPPEDDDTLYLPWILVKSEAEADEVKLWIQGLPDYTGSNRMMVEYRRRLPSAPVLALDTVESKLSAGDESWGKFDTLPYWEVDSESASSLKKIGWNSTNGG